MLPLTTGRARLMFYLLAWVPLVTFLLAYLAVTLGALTWPEAVTLSLPLALIFNLISLAPRFMCRVLPIGSTPAFKIFGNHFAAALAAGLIWIVVAKGLGLLLGHYFFPHLNTRLSPLLPFLCGIGVVLYMLSVFRHYMWQLVEFSKEAETREQKALTLARESELKALKAQINPHFLFNSLNSISALATVDGARARDMCIKLSDFLRTTLKLGEKPRITLADELALAKAYLDVERVRFGARLKVEIEADPECDRCVVPSLVLQPLVENAVKHGIAGLVEGGSIRIEAHCGSGRLQLEISNEYDRESPAPSRHGLGLRNVRERLRAIYENTARLDTSEAGDRFIVQLDLPCLEHV
jgi:two-component system, LytTR family, sensor histidine kinase AlgZ